VADQVRCQLGACATHHCRTAAVTSRRVRASCTSRARLLAYRPRGADPAGGASCGCGCAAFSRAECCRPRRARCVALKLPSGR
jgi:hypothetical protein